MMDRQIQMAWFVVAIIGAGAAARAAWAVMRGYEKLQTARDELDDSLHTHQKEISDHVDKL